MSCWFQGSDRREKARFHSVRLSYDAHDLFLVLFNAAVEESNITFAKVPFSRSLKLLRNISLKYPGSAVLL